MNKMMAYAYRSSIYVHPLVSGATRLELEKWFLSQSTTNFPQVPQIEA